MKTEKLVVLDFMVQDLEIHIYNIDPDLEVDEDLIKKLGHDPDACQGAFGTKAEVVKHKGTIIE